MLNVGMVLALDTNNFGQAVAALVQARTIPSSRAIGKEDHGEESVSSVVEERPPQRFGL
jgi:hypothetical protein